LQNAPGGLAFDVLMMAGAAIGVPFGAKLAF